MRINLRILVLWSTVVLLFTQSSAFFLSWGRAAEPPTPDPLPQWNGPFVYQQRLLQSGPPAQYTQHQPFPGEQQPQVQQPQVPIAMPAIPIQVPLQAHLSPAPNIHNVQLVPCLCPVSQEDVDKTTEIVYSSNNINKKN